MIPLYFKNAYQALDVTILKAKSPVLFFENSTFGIGAFLWHISKNKMMVTYCK